MNRFHAGFVSSGQAETWGGPLFFLDLDHVFDCERLGFPHTTGDGIAALNLLKSEGVSVVLNTGRSIEHVREYCRAYGLPGGIAEYGSVFLDAAGLREVSLIGAAAAGQLARCRQEILNAGGVFVDPGYHYSIRTYRFEEGRTSALSAAEVDDLLVRCGADRLTGIFREADTYIVQKGTGKGSGMLAVKDYLGCRYDPVVMIGDSEHDVEALRIAEIGYAPANCSREIRKLARAGSCRIVGKSFQKGLLATVLELLDGGASRNSGYSPRRSRAAGSGDLLKTLLQIADRPRSRQYLSALSRQSL